MSFCARENICFKSGSARKEHDDSTSKATSDLILCALALTQSLHVRTIYQVIEAQIQCAVGQRGERIVGGFEAAWQFSVVLRAVFLDSGEQRFEEVGQ